MRKLCFLILLILTQSFLCQSQSSLFGGLQFSSTSMVSDFENTNVYYIKPGCFLGYRIQPNQFLKAELMLEYNRTGIDGTTAIDGGSGFPIGWFKSKLIDLNAQFAMLYFFRIKGLEISVGLAPQYSISSKSKLKGEIGRVINGQVVTTPFNQSTTFQSKKKVTLNLPIQLEYKLREQIGLLFRYERGIINRLKSSDGTIKEFENDLKIGVTYYFQ